MNYRLEEARSSPPACAPAFLAGCGNRSCVLNVREAFFSCVQQYGTRPGGRPGQDLPTVLTAPRPVPASAWLIRLAAELCEKELMENALNDQSTGLDPHSAYMNAEEFREIQEDSTGEFSGLGVKVVPESQLFRGNRSQRMTPPFQGRDQGGRHDHWRRRTRK